LRKENLLNEQKVDFDKKCHKRRIGANGAGPQFTLKEVVEFAAT
jgi:hypothetical protein